MGFKFSAEEVFRIGEQIEVNGEKFYRAASASVADVKLKGALADLARQESAHQARFKQLREQLGKEGAGRTVFDPDEQTRAYLEATASTHIFTGGLDPEQHFKTSRSAREILGLALQFEKDSIIFYLGMQDFVSEALRRDTVDWLVNEEMKHVQQITAMMKEYS